eukprot:scaffold207030_cov21-Tisochrysis_lutea.AAC.1
MEPAVEAPAAPSTPQAGGPPWAAWWQAPRARILPGAERGMVWSPIARASSAAAPLEGLRLLPPPLPLPLVSPLVVGWRGAAGVWMLGLVLVVTGACSGSLTGFGTGAGQWWGHQRIGDHGWSGTAAAAAAVVVLVGGGT